MALYELHRRNILRHVVSQNCDGLHLRSGLPKKSLSEVHGNMYVEVCKNCKPNVEYWRLFDTTELTARNKHKTNRRCHLCGTPLVDTIVHFGEKGSLRWPLNWDGAMHNADKADVILCMGSSLKVLKKYSDLWSMDRPKDKRPQIYIVNLQWTPKDATATMKINGKCDEVMQLVLKYMNITVPDYNRRRDPIFAHASLLAPEELHTRSQPMLQGYKDAKKDNDDVFDEYEGNDCTGRSSEDSNDLPHPTPILRNDTKLLNSMEDCVVPKEIVANGMNVHSSSDRLNKINVHGVTTADTEVPVENTRDIQTTCSDKYSTNGLVSTNGTHSTETPLKSNGCSAEAIPELLCDKKPLNDAPLGNPPLMSNVQSVPVPEIIDPKLPQSSDVVDRSNNCNSSIKTPSPTKLPSRNVCLLNKSKGKFMQSISTVTLPLNKSCSISDRHKQLIDFCKLSCHLPHWYDSNYAYSGLHSIIYPPPTEVDLWESDVVPIFHLNRSDAECDFCFDNYAENNCQFYRPKTTEFSVTSCRKGRLVLCECCDYTDESDSENTLEYQDAKRIKLDGVEFIKDEKESVKVQAGWFGKGYRKMFRRKRRA